MPKNPIFTEVVRKIDQIQHEIDAHHWLLAVVLFMFSFQLMIAWSFADVREALEASAASQKRIYKDVVSLQAQVASLREAVATVQRASGFQKSSVEEASKAAPIMKADPAPAGAVVEGAPANEQPKPKVRR